MKNASIMRAISDGWLSAVQAFTYHDKYFLTERFPDSEACRQTLVQHYCCNRPTFSLSRCSRCVVLTFITENAWQIALCAPNTVFLCDSGVAICMMCVMARSAIQRPVRNDLWSHHFCIIERLFSHNVYLFAILSSILSWIIIILQRRLLEVLCALFIGLWIEATRSLISYRISPSRFRRGRRRWRRRRRLLTWSTLTNLNRKVRENMKDSPAGEVLSSLHFTRYRVR